MSRSSELEEFVERARTLPRQAQLDAAAIEVLDAFERVGIQPLLLKGPALARTLYRAEERRGYWDIDLLIARQDFPLAQQALVELGYANASEQTGVDDVGGIMYSETWLGGGPALQLIVDLHWRLAGCEAPAEIAWPVLSSRRAWIEINDRTVAVLDRDGLALHLATHAGQHGPDNLKAMADLVRGIERWDTEVWGSAAQLADQLDGTPAFAAGLRLIPAGAELARKLGLPPTGELTWAILHRDARPRGTFHLAALARAQGPRGRIDVVRRSLLPKREWITGEYPWANADKARLVAAYAAHLLRAPLWAARAWRYRTRERRAGR